MARVNLDNVRVFMKSIGYSERELAKAMGVSHSYVFRVFRDDRQPGGKFIEGLIKAGMMPEDIFLTRPLPDGNATTNATTGDNCRFPTGTDGR